MHCPLDLVRLAFHSTLQVHTPFSPATSPLVCVQSRTCQWRFQSVYIVESDTRGLLVTFTFLSLHIVSIVSQHNEAVSPSSYYFLHHCPALTSSQHLIRQHSSTWTITPNAKKFPATIRHITLVKKQPISSSRYSSSLYLRTHRL